MNPGLQGAFAAVIGLWEGIKPYIITLVIAIIIVTILCIVIVKVIHKK